MYECFICKGRGLPEFNYVQETARRLKRHLFGTHGFEKNFQVTCGMDGCTVSISSVKALTYHLQTYHNGTEWTPTYASVSSACNTADSNSEDMEEGHYQLNRNDPVRNDDRVGDVNEVSHVSDSEPEQMDFHCEDDTVSETTGQHVIDEDVSVYLKELEKTNHTRMLEACLGLARLKAENNLTDVAVESIKAYVKGLLTHLVSVMIGGCKKQADSREHENLKFVWDLGQGLANPYYGLTEHNLMKCMSKEFGYVEPKTIALLEEVTLQGTISHKMQYISVIETLKLLFKDDAFLNQVRTQREQVDGLLVDFCDGDYYRQHPLFQNNPSAMQLQLYYDDFEVVNPLGSKTSVHKTGALYYTFLNIHPEFRSSLRHIFLLALFYTNDLKHPEIGWKPILEPLNKELKLLESDEGVLVPTHGDTMTIQGTVAQVSMDNLAAHSFFGFQEKFSGNVHISRFCLCRGNDIQEQFHELDCTLRTREIYSEDLESVLETGLASHGVKSVCFLESKYFHPIENYAADAHHDILEGVVPQTLKPLLKVFIQTRKLFSLDLLNDRIEHFDYNAHDIKNKPSRISHTKLTDEHRSLKQIASQYWCLLRKLPLLVGDKIPEGDEHWELLLALNDIVEMILAPATKRELLPYMQTSICMFIEDYKRLFPELSVTPKMHNMLHYPRLIGLIGPLSRHWVMRFEGKHKKLKEIIDSTGNYINTPLTMAKRHQLRQIVEMQDHLICNSSLRVDKGKLEQVEHLPEFRSLESCHLPDTVTDAEKLTYHGVTLRRNDIFVLGADDSGYPDFGEIVRMVVYRNDAGKMDCVIVFQHFFTVVFNRHYYSWEVRKLPASPTELNVTFIEDISLIHRVGRHQSLDPEKKNVIFLNCKFRLVY